MKVALERSFPLPDRMEAAWALLQDIEAVADCMPGARITERIDDSHYKGTVSAKMGPASMSFRGQLEVAGIDAARQLVHLVGKGSDATGTSGATMDLTARIEPGPDAGSCVLHGSSEITLSGRAAAFGGRMMTSAADQILKDFAANFAADVTARAAATQASTPTPLASAGAAAAASTAAAAAAPRQASPAAADGGTGIPAPPPASGPAPEVARPPGSRRELSVLGLLWAVVRDAVLGLFGRGPRSGQPRVH